MGLKAIANYAPKPIIAAATFFRACKASIMKKYPIALHALIPIAAGFVVICWVIFVDHRFLVDDPHKAHSKRYLSLFFSTRFLEHLGIAFLSLGVVTMLLEWPHLKEYFYRILFEILTGDAYLQKQIDEKDPLWLKNLQTRVLTRLFGDGINNEGSFFHDYYDQLQALIGKPFRDNFVGETTITDSEQHDHAFEVDEILTYTCSKVGDHNVEVVGWTAKEDELLDMQSLSITLSADDLIPPPEPITIPVDSSTLKPGKGGGWGHRCALPVEYSDVAKFKVELKLKYRVDSDRAFEATVHLLTKNLSWTIIHPPDLAIHIDRFVFDRTIEDKKERGKCTYEYPHWLIPGDGFAYHFIKPRSQGSTQ